MAKLDNVINILQAIATVNNPWTDVAAQIAALTSVDATLRYAFVRIVREHLEINTGTNQNIAASTRQFFEKLDSGDWAEFDIGSEESALLPPLSDVASGFKALLRDYLVTRGGQIFTAGQSIIANPDNVDLSVE